MNLIHNSCIRRILAAILAALAGSAAAGSDELPGLTVRDGIQSTRLLTDSEGNAVFISPDQQRYAALLVRGDLDRDSVEAELVSGELSSLARASPKSVARLRSGGWGANSAGDGDMAWLTWPGTNAPVWIDTARVALLWVDEAGKRQVVAVNTTSGATEQLTHSATDVLSFAVSAAGTVVYRAKMRVSQAASSALVQKGFTVSSTHLLPLLAGYADGTSFYELRWSNEIFVAGGGGADDVHVSTAALSGDRFWYRLGPVFSPDGRRAILSKSPDTWSEDWNRYRSATLARVLSDRRDDPDGYLARQLDQLYVLDVERAAIRPLWMVPIDYLGARTRAIAWAPDGSRVVVGPTLLPVSSLTPSESEVGACIVNTETGEVTRLPVPAAEATAIQHASWAAPGRIELSDDKGTQFVLEYKSARWQLSKRMPVNRAATRTPVRVELKQGINTPPALYGTAIATGESRQLLDLNPSLRTGRKLARAVPLTWATEDGRQWRGRLYYPLNFVRGRRFPLVIQTHGSPDPDEFSIYGLGERNGVTLGPGVAGFLAQAIAARDIAVLQVPDVQGSAVTRFAEPDTYMAAYEAAVDQLVATGLVDRTRVGIYGYSATGWHVDYALANSALIFAAAVTTDNIDGSYSQAAMNSWEPMYGSDLNGNEPFGAGLKSWLERSPSFNAQRMRTPLQMQVTDSGAGIAQVVAAWELFSRLRRLGKAIELYLPPNVDRGSHVPQNPRQLLALQERTLDWWSFWLTDKEWQVEEMSRYTSWRRLRELRDADLKRPRAPELKWSSSEAGQPNTVTP